jgi:hypothetical protein
MPIKIKINVLKVPKEKLFVGKKGTYLDAILVDRPNEHGDDGFISMDVSKEEREAGVRGDIIGSWKTLGGRKPKAPDQRSDWPRD